MSNDPLARRLSSLPQEVLEIIFRAYYEGDSRRAKYWHKPVRIHLQGFGPMLCGYTQDFCLMPAPNDSLGWTSEELQVQAHRVRMQYAALNLTVLDPEESLDYLQALPDKDLELVQHLMLPFPPMKLLVPPTGGFSELVDPELKSLYNLFDFVNTSEVLQLKSICFIDKERRIKRIGVPYVNDELAYVVNLEEFATHFVVPFLVPMLERPPFEPLLLTDDGSSRRIAAETIHIYGHQRESEPIMVIDIERPFWSVKSNQWHMLCYQAVCVWDHRRRRSANHPAMFDFLVRLLCWKPFIQPV